MYATERKQMSLFIRDLYHWLGRCYGADQPGPDWPLFEIAPELKDIAYKAWLEFTKYHPLEKLNDAIQNARDAHIENHGLHGAQLSYKFGLVQLATERAASGAPAWKRKLLDLLDNLLESIGEGLPGFGALKEMKDALVGSLPE
ncbi:MAG: hypothetical protein HYV95_05835 [Opitutae bacterium]|nr:hypothetical protein [Opitutae bacterium]